MMIRNYGVAGALVILTALAAQAQPLNPSFETTTGRIADNWTPSGNVGFVTSTFGKNPTNGSKMLYLMGQNTAVSGVTTGSQVSAATLATALGTTTGALNTAAGSGHSVTTGAGAIGGSGATQTFTVTAGSSLTFTWDFLTTEDPFGTSFHNDMGFVSVNGVITSLGRLDEHPSIVGDTSANHYIPFTGGAVDGSYVESFLFETGDGTGNSGQRSTDYTNNSIGNPAIGFGASKFSTFTINFASAGSVQLGFGVLNANSSTGTTGGTPSALLVDNIVYTAGPGGGGGSAPEPGTFALLALGLGGAAFLRRRRA